MNWWPPTLVEIFMLTSVLECVIIIVLIARTQQVKGMLRAAVRKAWQDRNDTCRIPVNQVIETMRWEKVFPLIRPGSDFKKGPAPRHPALLSPARRQKLGDNKWQ